MSKKKRAHLYDFCCLGLFEPHTLMQNGRESELDLNWMQSGAQFAKPRSLAALCKIQRLTSFKAVLFPRWRHLVIESNTTENAAACVPVTGVSSSTSRREHFQTRHWDRSPSAHRWRQCAFGWNAALPKTALTSVTKAYTAFTVRLNVQ